jgi:hypothetical protein
VGARGRKARVKRTIERLRTAPAPERPRFYYEPSAERALQQILADYGGDRVLWELLDQAVSGWVREHPQYRSLMKSRGLAVVCGTLAAFHKYYDRHRVRYEQT